MIYFSFWLVFEIIIKKNRHKRQLRDDISSFNEDEHLKYTYFCFDVKLILYSRKWQMISLYIHIPFCAQKCKYCSFNVIPEDNLDKWNHFVSDYVDSLLHEIQSRWEKLKSDDWNQELRTLYFGGGTPSQIWKENLIKIIDQVGQYFNLEHLEELSVELNPFPEEEILDLIKAIQKKYKSLPRIRRSIGIQTFDVEILKAAWREYSFPGIADFLRKLQNIKDGNTVINLDFIAFGKLRETKSGNLMLWDKSRLDFFEKLIQSKFVDSFSLYTMELFPGSDRYKPWQYWDGTRANFHKSAGEFSDFIWDDDNIYAEFDLLKEMILNGKYKRYELSNFSSVGKQSIHNLVYRNMKNYIGLWTSASSFINFDSNFWWELSDKNKDRISQKFASNEKNNSFDYNIVWDDNIKWIRWTNTRLLNNYLKWDIINTEKTEMLSSNDLLIEEFFLRLRTSDGIANINKFTSILETDWKDKLRKYAEQNFVIIDDNWLVLSDQWMDIFNEIVTELLNIM